MLLFAVYAIYDDWLYNCYNFYVSRNKLCCVSISSLTLSTSDCSVCSCALYYCDLFHIQLSCDRFFSSKKFRCMYVFIYVCKCWIFFKIDAAKKVSQSYRFLQNTDSYLPECMVSHSRSIYLLYLSWWDSHIWNICTFVRRRLSVPRLNVTLVLGVSCMKKCSQWRRTIGFSHLS